MSETIDDQSSKQPERSPKAPARLPAHSMAAAAQRLPQEPGHPGVGVYYDVPHVGQHPKGWHLHRYIKRKRLHRSVNQLTLMERMTTRWSLLPLTMGLLIFMVIMGGSLLTYVALAHAINKRYGQQVLTLADILPKDSLRMYDENGTLIYEAADQGLQISEPYAKISPNIVNAEVAVEDKTFWSNPGYDITSILRAALADLTHHHIVQGGSTITQQLIKNVMVGNADTLIRKLKEVILAPEVTHYYTKQQILDMYLNTTFYGENAYGVEAAAFAYFDLQDTPKATAAQQLDIAQSAMLAGIPSDPSSYNPFLHPHASLLRMETVLEQMRSVGYITAAQEKLAIVEAKQPNFLHPGIIQNNQALQFVSYALNELAAVLHVKTSELSRSGLVVSTTLNLPLQNQVLKIAQEHIAKLSKTNNVTDAAEVLINYHNGAIRVLLGNVNPNNPQYGQFDVATQGYRQPGSAFKPFVYATAFEKGLDPGSPVLDAPTNIPLCCWLPPYQPHNYDLRYHGLVSVRYALQNSFNVPAVKVLYKTGVQASLHTAQAMGITSYLGTPNYTMVLGSLSVHLLDMTSAYGVFGNGGVRIPPHAINTVTNTQGQLVYQFAPKGQQVITPQVSFLISNTLSDNAARTYEFGPCSSLYLYSNSQTQCYEGNPGKVYPAAVKTGTSQNFMDNWTIGYTTNYVMGVWAGNNNNSPMVNVIGVTGAGPIWHDSMLLAEQGHSPTNFTIPPGVVQRTVHYPEGLTTTDWYIKGINYKDWGLGWPGSL